MSAGDTARYLRSRDRRSAMAREVVDEMVERLGLQPELPWGLPAEQRPFEYEELYGETWRSA